ncbi:winged helix-turn-helix transcriptional regulator [Pseudonocardia sp. EV170527-09]|uniref:winged helix-turn-helix transcriptional regulator n=1 Tax=Pseudonocardia sp. EV170527-09 TaxID=2603411 RepID=UPI00195F9A92|nr:winged helix-turn-helix transcriptional regulator [Pseudonocardia sp. EV170527-09]
MSERRHYGQFCGLAVGLDLLGERWTLLIVRELLLGPARFNDLLANLPGIGPNLLTRRLRSLVDDGLIEQHRLESDGRGRAYQLTDSGERLREPILALARWGLDQLPHVVERRPERGETRAAWAFLAVESMIDRSAVPDVNESYEFNVDDETFHIDVDGGQTFMRRGSATSPALVIDTDAETFVDIGGRLTTPFQAVVAGRLKIDGDNEALARCTRLMGLS